MVPAVRRLSSHVRTSSEEYRANQRAMEAAVRLLRERIAEVRRGGSEKARARHLARGKLLPRDRVEGLLDPGSPFLELSPLAAWEMYGSEVPARGRDHRHRPHSRPPRDGHLQRRDREGRHGLSDHRQEADLRAQTIAFENRLADGLPRRLGRSVPAAPGRDLPRRPQRRPRLLHAGAHVGRRAFRRSRS